MDNLSGTLKEHISNILSLSFEIENLRRILLSQGNNIDLKLYSVYKSKEQYYNNYLNSLTTK